MHAVLRAVTGALAVVVLATSGVAVADPGATPAQPTPTQPTPTPTGDVVILHTDSTSDAGSTRLRDALDDLGATVRHTFGSQQAVSVQLPSGVDPEAAGAQLGDLPGVAHVEQPVERTLAADPDDPQLPSQRAYLDPIDARPAWARQRGSAAVRIAIVDTGVDTGHPDLAGKIAGSYDAVTGSSAVTDTVGHGTFVAGVAAARTNNRLGIAGAGYDASILAVKVADRYGDIALDDEIAGIRWAADHGAAVINLSLSGPDPSSSELAAVRYAQAKGALVVAAAGNDATAVKQYPAAYPGVVAVAATDTSRTRRAAFSSHGSWVTLAAPGVGLISTTPRAGSDFFPTKRGYARGDGTSFAAPLVAGAAALLKAQNRAMTPAAIRTALVASAHGYPGNDIGAGQVDLDLALRHTAPTSAPTSPLVLGASGTVQLTALSSAPRVSFRVDDDPWLPPTPVTAGSARQVLSTFGLRDGSHRLSAVDCSEFGECNTATRTSTFLVGNAAPSLGSPTSSDVVSGRVVASGSGPGGGLRLLVDGAEVAFDATRDDAGTYAFTLNGSLFTDGTHDVSVQTCTVTHTHCDGPTSAATTVRFDSLHPTVTALSRAAISPNGDHSGDDATLTFALPEAQQVSIETLDAAGARRTDDLGRLDAGTHTYTFRGVDGAGARLPDGSYRLAVVTELDASTGTRHGLAERAVRIDTVAPRLAARSGSNATFYPVRDGYLDTFAPTAAVPDGGTLRLLVTTARGAVVRELRAARAPSSLTSLAWNGRTAAGRLAPAGVYTWRYDVTDEAGNVTRTAGHRVTVSLKQLRTRTITITRDAATKSAGSSARCAAKGRSAYRHGVHLVNRCAGGLGEVGYARYAFTVPSAVRYLRLRLDVYGRSTRTSQLTASFQRTDGGLEVPGGVRVARSKAKWRSLPSVPAAAHLHGRSVRVALVLTSRYGGTNDFDARSVRLRVSLTQLL